MKYYTVETLAMSIDPNRDYTVKEIEGLYQDYLSNLDGTVEFYRDIDALTEQWSFTGILTPRLPATKRLTRG